MVTLSLTPKQAQLLYVHITPRQDIDYLLLGTIVTTTEPTVPFRIDPVLLETLRYTAIMRASPTLQMHEWATWKEIVYILTKAMVEYKLGLPAHVLPTTA